MKFRKFVYNAGWSDWHDIDINRQSMTFTGTTSSDGNVECDFGEYVTVLSTYTLRGNSIITAYPVAGNRSKWRFHCTNDNANQSVIAETELSIAIIYIVD